MDLDHAYRQHYGSLVRFLYRRTGDQAQAEDLAQEAFVKAIEHRPLEPRPWLFRVATNLARDAGRKSSVRRRHLALVGTGRRGGDETPPSPEATAARAETIARVRAALAELTARDRDGLLLREEGLSYEEIAEVLGLSVGSVGTTLSRARARLVEAYESLDEAGARPGEGGGG